MGRAPCCDKANVKRGPWSPEEDAVLKSYVEQNGTGGNWIALPQKAGLKRCGKSCRLRWLNYLRPDIKHGGFTEEEDKIICTLYRSLGSRWSVIASNLRGRTDNDVKNYWNTKLKKKYSLLQCSSAAGGSSSNQHNLVSSGVTTATAASTSANFRPARQGTQSCDFSMPSLPKTEQPSPYSTLADCIPLPHPLDCIFSFASQDTTLPMPTFPDPSQPAGCLGAGSSGYGVSPSLDDISGCSSSSLTFDNGCSSTGGQQQWGPLEDDGFFSETTFGLNPEFLNWIGFCGGATTIGTSFATSGASVAAVEDVKPPQEVYQGVSYS